MMFTQSTDFTINSLVIYPTTTNPIDVRLLFEELSLFNNLFTPTQSGNIVIRDAINLYNKLLLDGNETIEVDITSDSLGGRFKKTFRITSADTRIAVRHTTQVYTLHFVSQEFLLSEKTRFQRVFQSKNYTSVWKDIITKLGGKIYTPWVHESDSIYDTILPSISPLEATDWISRRAINKVNSKPDFLSFETPDGYCFSSLSILMDPEAEYTYNFRTKDLLNAKLEDEFYSVKDMKVLANFDVQEAYKSGVYGGTFWGFDTLTRKWAPTEFNFRKLYGENRKWHCDNYPNVPELESTQEGSLNSREYNFSRISIYPYQSPRETNAWIKGKDSRTSQYSDNQEQYIFQRKHMFGMLQQKRIQILISGNFFVYCGKKIRLNVPKFTHTEVNALDSMENLDEKLSGMYIVAGVRHLIKYNKFETVVELTSDSKMKEIRG